MSPKIKMIKLSMLWIIVPNSRTSLLTAPLFSLLNDFPLRKSIFVVLVARSSVLNCTLREQPSWQVKQLIHSFSPKSSFLFQKGRIITSGAFYVTETEYVPSFLISWTAHKWWTLLTKLSPTTFLSNISHIQHNLEMHYLSINIVPTSWSTSWLLHCFVLKTSG